MQQLPGAEIAGRDPGPQLADHGVIAVDERHGGDPARGRGGVGERPGVGRRRGDRLLADDVLAREQRVARLGDVEVVGRADVDHVDAVVAQDGVHVRIADVELPVECDRPAPLG